MPISGRLEVTLKIGELPAEVSTDKNGWKSFVVDCGQGQVVRVTMRPKNWTKLETAAKTWPQWSGAIGGALRVEAGGMSIAEATVATFEKKAKPAVAPAAGAAAGGGEAHAAAAAPATPDETPGP